MNCTPGTGNPITLNGYDFSLHGGVFLQINAGGQSADTITIENCNFLYLTGSFSQIYMIQNSSSDAMVFNNNIVDGNGAVWTNTGGSALILAGSVSFSAQYNAFFRAPSRFVSYSGAGNFNWQYNYGEGLYYNSLNGNHGEQQVIAFTGTMTQFTHEYSVFMEPSNTANSTTAAITPAEFGGQATFSGYIAGTTLTYVSGTVPSVGTNLLYSSTAGLFSELTLRGAAVRLSR